MLHGCRQQGHAGSKTLHQQQNSPVLNRMWRLTQADQYNGRKTVVVVVVLVLRLVISLSPRRRLGAADVQRQWTSGTGSHVVPALVAEQRRK